MTEKDYEQFCDFINKTLYETMDLHDYEIILNDMDIPIKSRNGENWRLLSGCHNLDYHKVGANLAFNTDTLTFTCFSECGCSMSLLTLVQRRFELMGEKKSKYKCMKYICDRLSIPFDFNEDVERDRSNIYNWKNDLLKYLPKNRQQITLKKFDKKVLNYFEPVYHQSWLNDHISLDVMEQYKIRYYPYHDSIIIPCMDKDGDMIGIRERFLNPNSEYKYLPLKTLKTDYSFPVNQTLYGLNYNSENIKHYKLVVLGEAEKFTMQCQTYFGNKNCSVSLYGKSMSNTKLKQIMELQPEEVVIALDYDYEKVWKNDTEYTEDFKKFKKNVYRIGDYFKPFCKVSSLISYSGHRRNQSATDDGKEKYLELFNNREILY